MFLSTYLFSMAAGGVVLLASIFLGGQDDADGPAELEAGDADLDADLDADVDADVDAAAGGDASADAADFDADALVHIERQTPERQRRRRRRRRPILGLLLSLRFWTFFMTFFGLTGAVFEGFALVTALPALVIALTMGTGAGAGATLVFRYLAENSTGAAASNRDYIGQSGRVLVTINPGGLGKIRLQIKGTTVDMLATCETDTPLTPGELAVIIEIRETTAVVVRQGELAAVT